MTPSKDLVTGVILAGGRARRMGKQDKGLLTLRGKPLIEYSLARLEPQVAKLVINANRNIERYQAYGYPVITDRVTGYAGPLAGMLSALAVIETEYLLTVPCDCPLFPKNLAFRLFAALEKTDAEISVVSNGIRRQPVFLLLHRRLEQDLANYLNEGGRKIDTWLEQHPLAEADFSDQPDAFLNVNTPRDINELESRLQENALNSAPDRE